jgi:ADP-ribose pyrophosphatase YjhB (NUDIX family)
MLKAILKLLLRVWRIFPVWAQFLAARLLRPRYRVGVVAVIFDEQGRILLFHHTYRKLAWGLPAGGLEHGEDPAEAVQREFREETGIEIEADRMLMAVSAKVGHHISLVYLCHMKDEKFQESLEISEMRFFDPKELPIMLLTEKQLIQLILSRLEEESRRELA